VGRERENERDAEVEGIENHSTCISGRVERVKAGALESEDLGVNPRSAIYSHIWYMVTSKSLHCDFFIQKRGFSVRYLKICKAKRSSYLEGGKCCLFPREHLSWEMSNLDVFK
jgi:hypothetical protein